ncbi:hypothetical protein D9757_012867 [Collybiopsis confluens]|uniref:rRNA N-glycosylase n=1 Tax=Collybiopsis confluens TaxID=2823264 RepID=A0A8H5G1K1_9AGAR|nr:hypothetical protein D9757_012867 [Collybiopsis confluens]
MVKFTAKFAVDNPKGELAYHAFIKDLRERLAAGDIIKDVPILAPQVALGGVLEFFDAELRQGSSSGDRIYLKLQTDNLSLIGFRPYGSNTWHELGPEGQDTPLINEPGTTTEMLGFGSSYDDLCAAGNKQLKDIQLSSDTISFAIQRLAWTDHQSYTSKSEEFSIAWALLQLKFAISEAIKLRNVSSFISKSWSAGEEGLKPDAALIAQVYSWARLSSAVQRVQNEGVEFYVDGQMTNIWSFEEAVLALGIMHLTNTTRSSRLKHPITDLASIAPFPQGQPLLEIFYVRVNEIVQSSNTFHGRIYVTDSVGSVIVWTTNNTITAVTGEELVFIGPSRPLYAADQFTIGTVLLHSSTTADTEIDIKFNPFDYYAGAEYDVPIIRRISQTWGSANVCYMAMTNGLYAKISVILVKRTMT